MSVPWSYVLKFVIIGDAGECESTPDLFSIRSLKAPSRYYSSREGEFNKSHGARPVHSCSHSHEQTSLLVRLTDQRFLQNPDPTLGVEFGSKLIQLEDIGETVKLQCWDTAGSEAFR